MKRYVALFERFEEEFDDFYQKPDTRSDNFYQQIAKELVELANQYCDEPVEINVFSDRYGTATRIKDLENDLLVMVYDQMGEQIAEEFAAEADDLLASYEITERKKMNGSKVFAKKNPVKDNGLIGKKKAPNNLENPSALGKMTSLRK